jgi:hypothetical protein
MKNNEKFHRIGIGLFIAAMMSAAAAGRAESTPAEYFTFATNGSEVVVTGFATNAGSQVSVTIPGILEVFRHGDRSGRVLEQVGRRFSDLPESLRAIGDFAFYNCKG